MAISTGSGFSLEGLAGTGGHRLIGTGAQEKDPGSQKERRLEGVQGRELKTLEFWTENKDRD